MPSHITLEILQHGIVALPQPAHLDRMSLLHIECISTVRISKIRCMERQAMRMGIRCIKVAVERAVTPYHAGALISSNRRKLPTIGQGILQLLTVER